MMMITFNVIDYMTDNTINKLDLEVCSETNALMGRSKILSGRGPELLRGCQYCLI